MAAYKSRRHMLDDTVHGEMRHGALDDHNDDEKMRRRTMSVPMSMSGTKVTRIPADPDTFHYRD